MAFKLLKFDTKLFGFKVAKILPQKLSLEKLSKILNKLRLKKIRLVYWQAPSADKKSRLAAKKLNGFLSAKQITYLINLKKIPAQPIIAPEIKTYRAKKPTPEMNQLAIQIGALSRFGTDPQMPKKLFHKMYHAWIKNSVNGSAADKVLVIKNRNRVIGFITLATKNKRGNIRLLAVAPNYRGKKLATKLTQAATNYFLKKKYTKLQVVTQKSNIPACRLYKKCGFHQEKVDNFYHFWL